MDAPASAAMMFFEKVPTIEVAAALAPRFSTPVNSHAFVFPAAVTFAITRPLTMYAELLARITWLVVDAAFVSLLRTVAVALVVCVPSINNPD